MSHGTPRSVVICHVYNEELLLPFWLAHHSRLFDHGIILDYASTDRTRQIAEQWDVPWEVRPSRNTWFDPLAADAEIMDIESEFGEGVWKMALNVTEYVFASHLDHITRQCPSDVPALALDVASMIDPPERRAWPVDPRYPLYLQRHHGAFGRRKNRFLHRARHGCYRVGRHKSDLPAAPTDRLVLWWGFSPFDAIKARKLQIGGRIPPSVPAAWGAQHKVDAAGLETLYREQSADTQDLLEDPRFRDGLLDICRDWPDWHLPGRHA